MKAFYVKYLLMIISFKVKRLEFIQPKGRRLFWKMIFYSVLFLTVLFVISDSKQPFLK